MINLPCSLNILTEFIFLLSDFAAIDATGANVKRRPDEAGKQVILKNNLNQSM